MAPKNKFSKEQIIDVAFKIAREEGINSITLRKVADKLGGSIAPIYVNFKSIDELIQEVIKNIYGISKQLLEENDTGRPFYDIGVTSLKFAREYSVLFRDLMLSRNNHLNNYDNELGFVLIEKMKKDPDLSGFNDAELKNILMKMRIFQLGLSVMTANELLPEEFDERKTIEMLNATAADIIKAARIRNDIREKFE